MSDDLFNVSVPDESLEAPAFELMPTGAYRTTLQAGAELVEKDGWTRVHLPFRGFVNGKASFPGRNLEARFPVGAPEGANDKQRTAARIGQAGVIGAAAALALTEPTTTAEGKPGQKLIATSNDELIAQFNAMAGTEVEVYVVAKARTRNGQVVQRTDGNGAVMDNEIRNVRTIGKEAA